MMKCFKYAVECVVKMVDEYITKNRKHYKYTDSQI